MNNYKKDIRRSLKEYFGYESFRPGQESVIRDVLAGESVIGVLPTGSGKSICYQLPALLSLGLTLVISPLVSLMLDQVKELKSIRFPQVTALHSLVGKSERAMILENLADYKLLYISPELLQNKVIMQYLQMVQIDRLVIDEAHCISQWGHEFRPDYLRIADVHKQLEYPPVLALSATATDAVREDIRNILNLENIKEHIYPMDRKNISLTVHKIATGHEAKLKNINHYIKNFRVPTIIFFSNRQLTEDVAEELSSAYPNRRVAYYHGQMEHMDRILIQQQFINDQIDIICCTSAFGMGINKPNIRLVIHYHVSQDLESFIQEIGRAGRDDEKSASVVLYSDEDIERNIHLLKNDLITSNQLKTVFSMLQSLASKQEKLPSSDREIETLFQLADGQWRFLFYQFEKHGMIKKDTVHYNSDLWQQAFYNIKRYMNERKEIKEAQLLKMINWLQDKKCLRQSLYKNFQDTVQKLDSFCCTNCTLNLKDWKPNKIEVDGVTKEQTWADHLYEKLYYVK